MNSTQNKQTETGLFANVPVSFIKEVFAKGNTELKERFEKEFPLLFPRPTFRVGETVEVDCLNGVYHLLIVGSRLSESTMISTINLVNLMTGTMKNDVFVADLNNITEQEFLEAGEGFNVNKNNYRKVNIAARVLSSELKVTSC